MRRCSYISNKELYITVVKQFQNIERGYEDMIGKLKKCNADLQLLPEGRVGHDGGAGPHYFQ